MAVCEFLFPKRNWKKLLQKYVKFKHDKKLAIAKLVICLDQKISVSSAY